MILYRHVAASTRSAAPLANSARRAENGNSPLRCPLCPLGLLCLLFLLCPPCPPCPLLLLTVRARWQSPRHGRRLRGCRAGCEPRRVPRGLVDAPCRRSRAAA